MKELLTTAELRTDKDGRTRDAKSLRQTGISLRLDLGPANPDYRDIAKWARTSPAMSVTLDDRLVIENRREVMKELLTTAELRTDKDGRTRDAKSLRQTGISLRLDLGPANPDYRDIAKWARTS